MAGYTKWNIKLSVLFILDLWSIKAKKFDKNNLKKVLILFSYFSMETYVVVLM